MSLVLVATRDGFRAFTSAGEGEAELRGRSIDAVSSEIASGGLAVIDGHEIWRRRASGAWTKVGISSMRLQSITSVRGVIFGGAMDEAAIIRMVPTGEVERLAGFDNVRGRGEWFAGGPPLGVRALTATADGAAVLAAVHVGGIPRSANNGQTWAPTIPISYDVHEVRSHPSLSNLVAAATAVGLCVSCDGGLNWTVFSEGLEVKNSLAVAVLHDEVLFGISDGPAAKRSQVWRWKMGEERLDRVGEGLPEWLEGKIDTAWIATGGGRAAILDGGGNLWLSATGSRGWQRIAADLPYAFGILVL
jgi:hypothetical protein